MRSVRRQDSGFTFVELLTVASLIGILMAMAAPSLRDMWRNMQYKSTAREIASALRDAQNRAVTFNLEHRIEFDLRVLPARSQYRVTQGNRAANSNLWNVIARNWAPIPENVIVATNNLLASATTDAPIIAVGTVVFHPNGTATLGGGATPRAQIFVRAQPVPPAPFDTRFTVGVESTGRIRIAMGQPAL